MVERDSADVIHANLRAILREMDVADASEDIDRLRSTVENACDDCRFLDQVSHHFRQNLSLTSSLEHELDQLRRENEWIGRELDSSQQESLEQQQRIAALESENERLRLQIQLTPARADSPPPATPPAPPSAPLGEAGIPDNLATLNSLVLEYAAQGRYEVAVPLCKQALSELELLSGEDHPEIATLLNILALAYRDQGQFKLAAKYLERCLRIKEQLYGERHSSVAATLNNLAILYCKRGKYKDAEPLCKRALRIREDTLGTDHHDTAKQLNNLGLVCQHLGRYDEVEGYYLRALDIYRRLPERDELNIIKTTNNLASAYLKLDKLPQAEALYKSIIADLPVEGPPIWQLAESRPFHEALLPPWLKVLDIYGASLMTTLTNLSALYRRRSCRAGEFIEQLLGALRAHAQSSQEDSTSAAVLLP